MTPKDKAKELINKYKHIVYSIDNYGDYDESIALVNAKSCALIAVDEIIKIITNLWGGIKEMDYWHQVKNEIEKI